MKRAAKALFAAGLAAFSFVLPAHAQPTGFPTTMPPNTIYGRSGVSTGPGQAIPFSLVLQALGSSPATIVAPWTFIAPQTITVPGVQFGLTGACNATWLFNYTDPCGAYSINYGPFGTGASVFANRSSDFNIANPFSLDLITHQVYGIHDSTAYASFTGTISGTALTISGLSGTLGANYYVYGTGVAAGTTIASGSGNSWTVNASQTVGPVAMTAVPYLGVWGSYWLTVRTATAAAAPTVMGLEATFLNSGASVQGDPYNDPNGWNTIMRLDSGLPIAAAQNIVSNAIEIASVGSTFYSALKVNVNALSPSTSGFYEAIQLAGAPTGSSGPGHSIVWYSAAATVSGVIETDNTGVLRLHGANNVKTGDSFASLVATAPSSTAALALGMSSTANLGIWFGTGAPTGTAAEGSLYVRTDTGLPYYNNNGSTGWTQLAPITSTITINGTVCTLASSCTPTSTATLVVGTSVVSSCSNSGYILYNNGGVLGCQVAPGGGNVSNFGTPTGGQIAQWQSATTIQGISSVPVANGGTNCTSASITCFNNITGFSAAGSTGTTSTNLVFSGAPTFTGVVGFAAGSSAAPSVAVGGGTTGLYSVSTTGFGFSVNGTLELDWGITNANIWTAATSLTVPNAGYYIAGNQTLSRNGGTGTVTLASSAANVVLSPAGTTALTASATLVNIPVAASFTGGVPSLSNGTGAVAADAVKGGLFTGKGSTWDLIIQDSAGTAICSVATGSGKIGCTTFTVSTQFQTNSFIANGAAPTGNTGTCSTAVTVTGGPFVGNWTSTSACNIAGTIILSSMPSVPTGYACDATDITTSGVVLQQTASSTTSVTFTVRSVNASANDNIRFKCIGY